MQTMTMTRSVDQAALVPATVLVVEDETMVRMPIAEYLRDCGYNVLEAGDAYEAMALVDSAVRVDVVFSDIRMPGKMDGLDLARWLRRNRPELPILLTSGYNASRALPGDVAHDVKLIDKPYSQAQVARRIEALVRRPG